jgi:ABC-type transport system involved in cytochrome c biogenesis permease component
MNENLTIVLQVMAASLMGTVLLVAYLIPTIIAIMRDHRNKVPIFVVNLLLGWVGIPWAVALAWSLMDDTRRQELDVRVLMNGGPRVAPSDRPVPVVERWKAGTPW